jgi:hypothetical protein
VKPAEGEVEGEVLEVVLAGAFDADGAGGCHGKRKSSGGSRLHKSGKVSMRKVGKRRRV